MVSMRSTDQGITAIQVVSMVPTDLAKQTLQASPGACGSPMQIVAKARQYFGVHLQEPIEITALPQALGVAEDCLNFSFEQVRGMTPAQTKVLNKLDRYALLVTSNQPFSEWENVFSTSAMTVAAVDRLVDHSTLIQINGESYRRRRARRASGQAKSDSSPRPGDNHPPTRPPT